MLPWEGPDEEEDDEEVDDEPELSGESSTSSTGSASAWQLQLSQRFHQPGGTVDTAKFEAASVR